MAALPPWCTGNLVPYRNPDYCSDPNIEKQYLKCNDISKDQPISDGDRKQIRMKLDDGVKPNCAEDPYKSQFESWVDRVIKLLEGVNLQNLPPTFKQAYPNIPLPLWAVYASQVVAKEDLEEVIVNYANYVLQMTNTESVSMQDILQTFNQNQQLASDLRIFQTTDYASNYYPMKLQTLVNKMRNAQNPMYYPPLVPPVQLVTAPAVMFEAQQ